MNHRVGTLWTALALTAAALRAAEIHGIDPADMDPSASPCVDFYRYADGGWLKKNPIPSDYPSWGAFNELDERNREVLHQILEKLSRDRSAAAPGSEERKLGDFYAACMDETTVEAQGITPLAPALARIDRISSVPELARERSRGSRCRVSTPSSSSARSRTARTSRRSSAPRSRGGSACRTATTTRRPTRSRRAPQAIPRPRREDAGALGRDQGEGAVARAGDSRARDEARGSLHDPGRTAGPRRDVQPDDAGFPRRSDAGLLVDRLLPRPRRGRHLGRQRRRSRSSSKRPAGS